MGQNFKLARFIRALMVGLKALSRLTCFRIPPKSTDIFLGPAGLGTETEGLGDRDRMWLLALRRKVVPGDH